MTVIMATRQAEIMDWQRALSSDNLACTDLRLHGAVKGRTSHHERGPLNWCFPPRVLHAFDLTLRPMSGRSNRTLPQAASLRTDPHVCGSNSRCELYYIGTVRIPPMAALDVCGQWRL